MVAAPKAFEIASWYGSVTDGEAVTSGFVTILLGVGSVEGREGAEVGKDEFVCFSLVPHPTKKASKNTVMAFLMLNLLIG